MCLLFRTRKNLVILVSPLLIFWFIFCSIWYFQQIAIQFTLTLHRIFSWFQKLHRLIRPLRAGFFFFFLIISKMLLINPSKRLKLHAWQTTSVLRISNNLFSCPDHVVSVAEWIISLMTHLGIRAIGRSYSQKQTISDRARTSCGADGTIDYSSGNSSL